MNGFAELAGRARRGDAEAFAELYRGIYRELYRAALYMLKRPEDAEDAVADAVADAFASMGKLRDAEAFRGWMFRILAAKCKRKMREYANRTVEWEEARETGLWDGAGVSEDPADAVAVRHAFGKLQDEDRLVVSLMVFGGYRSAEVARMLGSNENTVRSRKSRALRKMAELLGEA